MTSRNDDNLEIQTKAQPTHVEAIDIGKAETQHVDNAVDIDKFRNDAIEAETLEHQMTVMQAVKAYPMACFWALMMSTTIIMEAYCVFIMGSFVALPAFRNEFGIPDGEGSMVIAPSWQSALQMGGPLGALIGVFIAGPLTSRIGYRWATIGGLMWLNATIFVFFFASSLGIFFASQVLEGLSWGIFIANAPAYCSEIVPMRLRAPATQMLQMFWSVGAIIVGGATYAYQDRLGSEAYRLPIALQWIFPTPLAVAIFLAPESPWWLVRKGRLDQAAKSLSRLGRKSQINAVETVAMMRRVVDRESDTPPTLVELFRHSDLRRTLIVSGIYAGQNLAGNLISNQSVFFFEQAGMQISTAFALGLATSALQSIFVCLSWFLSTYFGRRPIYLWGTGINAILLFALGVAACVGKSVAASNAQAALGLIVSVGFTFGAAPMSFAIIAETSSIRLRPLTTGVGRAAYYIVNIPCIFLGSYMLNPTGANLGGKCGFVWGGTATFTLVLAYFFLPEMKNRSYRELDILFQRRIPARKFRQTVIDINEDE